jgi:hypothetical protein
MKKIFWVLLFVFVTFSTFNTANSQMNRRGDIIPGEIGDILDSILGGQNQTDPVIRSSELNSFIVRTKHFLAYKESMQQRNWRRIFDNQWQDILSSHNSTLLKIVNTLGCRNVSEKRSVIFENKNESIDTVIISRVSCSNIW